MEKKYLIYLENICNQDFLGKRDSVESILITLFLTVQVLLLNINVLPALKFSILWVNICKNFVR